MALAWKEADKAQAVLPCLEETFDSLEMCDAAHLVVLCMYKGKLAEELSAEQLVLVLQTLPDSCALLPEHKKWQDRVHSLAGELSALPILLHLYGDVHAVITSAKLREYFQQLPFAAVQQWAGSDALTVDSENSVVELISLWMAGTVGKRCSSGELLRRSTIRWDVPRQQLVDLLASKDLMAMDGYGDNSFLDKSLATAADLEPFLEDGLEAAVVQADHAAS
ncbi:BACK domain-containing protein [Haematococcus lacustris]|uniref:BACK domain-containing protein n=1 Tax=Haematococcus lacustris TaxID=44745 RepID=A0A699YP77_HAELA|nr:BACK domain-containing protein [Haematococcus lacustris]